MKLSVSLSVAALFIIGSIHAVPERTEHGTHGAEKHKSLHFKNGKHNTAFDLDALLASQDQEELEDLPDDVRKNRLRVLAKAHDTNGNGVIEENELLDWVLHSFKLLDRIEADEARKDDDDNQDGKVSFTELLTKRYGFSPEDIEKLESKKNSEDGIEEDESETLVMVDEDKNRFDLADLNKDGLLDDEEFVAFHQPYDHPHMHALEMERAMKEYDNNNDGFVEMEEFVKAEDEEERLSEQSNFENLDKDKDGKCSAEEFKAWVLVNNDEIAGGEVKHLLQECDENEDGQLTIEEIVEKENEFVSSQATDYGRHLHFIKDEL